MIKITDPNLSNFYAVKPDFNILEFDFTRRSNCQRLIDSLVNQNGDAAAASDVTFDEPEETLERLKAYQRLLRLEPNEFTAEALHGCGYESAWQIASKSEKVFKQELKGRLSEENAQRIYRKARGVKGRTLYLWATVQNLVKSPHFRAMRPNNVSTELVSYLSSQIPGYDDLFGSLDYYEVEHCQSILSPAAYFVELMWYIEQYYTQPASGVVPTGFTLDERRPDLKDIELTCENSLDSVPFLHILNDVLRARIEGFSDVGAGNANCYFATAVYPWRVPFNLPLEQIRGYLVHLQAELPEIYRTFGAGADVIGQTEVGLSVEMATLVTTSKADDDSKLKDYYGLESTANLDELEDRDLFLKQSGLTRPELVELLDQNLTQAEKEAGLGHHFYINQVLGSDGTIELQPDDDDPTQETLPNLSQETLDRIHRFVRLAQVLGWSFADLDTALRAIGISADKDIDGSALNTLGHLCTLQRRYDEPVDVLCALFADMNTIGIGDPKKPVALFERIYNLPSRLGGNQQPYRPHYEGSVEGVITSELNWQADGTTSDEPHFSAARMAASLGLSPTNLNALRQILWGDEESISLSVHNLTLLYRFTVMSKLLGMNLQDYRALAELLNIDVATILEPAATGVLEDFERLVAAADWLKQQGWTLAEMDYVLNGREYKTVDALIKTDDIPELMEGFWAQNLPTVSAAPDDDEIAMLNEGLALYLGIDSELFPGLAHFVAQITGVENYLELLYTPTDVNSPDPGYSFDAEELRIEVFLDYLSRYHLLATKIGLTGCELSSAADYPTQYNLPGNLPGTYTDPIQLEISHVHALSDFKALVLEFDDTENGLVGYLEAIGNSALSDIADKIAALSTLSGWPEDELSGLLNSAEADLGYSNSDLESVVGLARVSQAFELIEAMGGSVTFVRQLLSLGSLSVDTDSWAEYTAAADAVSQVVQSKYVGEELDEVTRKLNDPLDEALRDVMTDFSIWRLNQDWAGTGRSLENRQDLSEYLLVDVEMEGVSESTPIKQGQLSLQMYAQRCQLGLEEGIQPLDLDSSQWEWMLDYRLWEANRKIYLYPENYVEPDLRIEKSVEFATLQNELQQGAVTDELVETAFLNYFNSFETLAKLQIVETARYKIKDPSRPNPIDTLLVFGKTVTEPTRFYYRRCTDPASSNPVWQYWEKINLQINATTVMPAYAFHRLFIFWVEQKEITKNDGQGRETTEIQVTIKYSFLNSHNKWVEPQNLVADYTIDGLTVDDSKDLVWQRPYALVVPVTEPDSDEETEEILVFLGETPTEYDATEYDNRHIFHSWGLRQDLLSEKQRWTFRTNVSKANEDEIGEWRSGDWLSEGRYDLAATSVGSLAIFAGGYSYNNSYSPKVDIYNAKTGEWISGDWLSEGRYYLAATSVGSLAIFAGGYGTSYSRKVDIYNAKTGEWTSGDWLSEGRRYLAATSVGSLAIFAGGYNGSYSRKVDIYNAKTGEWTSGDWLSEGRGYLAATSVGSLAIFAGGWNGSGYSRKVDIYNAKTGEWTSGDWLSEGRGSLAATSVGSLAIFAGGYGNGYSPKVDIYNAKTGEWISGDWLSEGRHYPAATSVGSLAIFAGGWNNSDSRKVDIYNAKTGEWISGDWLSEGRRYLAATSVGSLAIFAGGYGNGYSRKVDIFYVPPDGSNLPPALMYKPDRLSVDLSKDLLSENYRSGELIVINNHDLALLLGSLPKNLCQISSVKNQAGWSVFYYGQKAFLSQPEVEDSSETIKETINIEETVQFSKPESDGGQAEKTGSYGLWSSSNVGSWDSDSKLLFSRLTTDVVHALTRHLFTGGLDRLLSLDTQQNTKEFDFDKFGPTAKVIPPTNDHLDFDSAYGPYFWELFYHVPSLVANTLNTHQQFTDAQHWYQYIFNPTAPEDDTLENPTHRVWQFLPFRDHTLQTLEKVLADEQQMATSMGQPFDPHAIAQLRIGAYEKVIVMKYIDNLIDWGDYYFTQDTWESINRAATLYFLANDILGPRPRNLGTLPAPEPKTYSQLAIERAKATQEMLALEQIIPTATAESDSTDVFPLETITDYFGVNENQDFVAYWDRVEDRLYKIRNGMNIQGIERSLALYQPPVDPAQLVTATAAGGGSVSFPTGTDVPHYRFDAILARARNVTNDVIQLGSTLLATLEKQDAEELARIQFGQQTILMQIITQAKEQQIEAAEANLASLQESLAAAQYRQDYYQKLIDAGWLSNEDTGINAMETAMNLRLSASITNNLAAVGYALPDTFGLANGGMDFGKVTQSAAEALNANANYLSDSANIALTTAQFKRREGDWELQLGLAERDIPQIEQQIAAAEVNLEMAKTDLDVHQKSIEQAQEVETFFQTKFTNKELYQWMVGKLSSAYYQCYQIALSLAGQAEKAYQYELNKTDIYLQPNCWDSLRKGLTAGEQLMWGLNQLEKAYLDGNSRMLEIERTVSLLQEQPEALLNLKDEGHCTFTLSERLFDQDYPGQYCRQIKTVSISIPAIVGPYQNLKATLTQTEDQVLMEPELEGVKYLLGEIDEARDSIRRNWRQTQQIAISRGIDDYGLFTLDFNDERYLPFEGTGAVSTWTLEMPKAANAINFDSIGDVLIHVKYTALYDGSLQNQVVELDSIKTYAGDLYLSLRQFVPDAWYLFLKGDENATLSFTLTESLFRDVAGLSLGEDGKVKMFLQTRDAIDGATELELNGNGCSEDGTVTLNGSIGQEWTINLSDSVNGPNPDDWLDVILVIPYEGTLDWHFSGS